MAKLFVFFKDHLIFLVVILLIIYTFSPSLKLHFSLEDWSHFATLTNKFGHTFPISNMPLSFYFTQYGTLLFSISFLHKLFGFNPFAYYFVNLLFRIIASFSLYYLTYYISRKKIVGIVAGLIFGISYPGIENTTWATLFWVFPAITVMCIFLLLWYKFHENLTTRYLVLSISLFWVTLFIYPVRTFGLPLVVAVGEGYWITSNLFKYKLKRIEVLHFVILSIIFLGFLILTSSFKTTPELSSKLISSTVFLNGLLNGYPPIFLSIWLFIGNLFLPPDFLKILEDFKINLIKSETLIIFSIIASIVALFFMYLNFVRRRFNFFILSIIPLIFPALIYLAVSNLSDWQYSWIITAQIGGSIFIWTTLLSLVIWKEDKKLFQILFLGILLLISHLIIPWLVLPQVSNNDQSAFNLTSRYYTIPSIGSSIIFGCLFYFFLKKINSIKVAYLKLSLLFLILALITAITTLDIYLSHKILEDRLVFLDRREYENIWLQIKPLIKSEKKDEVKVAYIKGKSSESLKYMLKTFSYRLAFEEGHYSASQNPTYLFIADEKDIDTLSSKYDYFLKLEIKDRIVREVND